jgi:hypothetical protein
MDNQLTLRIPASLAQKLDREARRLRRKRSDLVRLALEEFLVRPGDTPPVRPVTRVRDLLGSIESGVPDLGQHHREHLLRRLRRVP